MEEWVVKLGRIAYLRSTSDSEVPYELKSLIFTRYQMALFVAEVLQGTGQAMNLKWVIEGRSHTGTFCTAQGALEISPLYNPDAT
jgi:hypothetical protein